ncbi:dTDP-4-dehydrorhamnose reductase [Sphingobacteriales bacterium CHB3]|nr:dTDP-4-dehydrorhamnose reductase [Sphingobacteriales bacterium CHB3]
MNSKKILVIGSNGLLGQKLCEIIVRGGAYSLTIASIEEKPVRQVVGAQYQRVDITNKKDVKSLVFGCNPDVIINAAAMTNVDACETEREMCWKINVEGVENIVEAAKRADTKVIHVSTDYVFDGKAGPYTEDDRPEPLSYYGKSKLASETAVRTGGVPYMIARTMVLYGFAPGVKPNFALWLIDSLESGKPVNVVDDQFGNPTLVDDLAYGLIQAFEMERTGIYNIAGRDIVSRYEFALKLAKVFNLDPHLITPIKTSTLKQPAPRPLKSGLITLKAEVELGYRPSTVEQGLLILKTQLNRTLRMLADSGPIPAQNVSKPRG